MEKERNKNSQHDPEPPPVPAPGLPQGPLCGGSQDPGGLGTEPRHIKMLDADIHPTLPNNAPPKQACGGPLAKSEPGEGWGGLLLGLS